MQIFSMSVADAGAHTLEYTLDGHVRESIRLSVWGGHDTSALRVLLAGAQEGPATICARAPDRAKVYARAARGHTREEGRKGGLSE